MEASFMVLHPTQSRQNVRKKTIGISMLVIMLLVPLSQAVGGTAAPSAPQQVVQPQALADNDTVTVTIVTPVENRFYLNDRELGFNLTNRTFIYGGITIVANASTTAVNQSIAEVEFFVDGSLIGNDTTAPYNVSWSPMIQFSLSHVIEIVATDTAGNNGSANITVMKWRFHAAPIVIAAGLMALSLVPHTSIRGIAFNPKISPLGKMSFYAIRVKYHTTSLLHKESGTILFEKVTLGQTIAMTRSQPLGPLGNLVRISGIFLGKIR
jgi:hypothetical protein